MTVQTQAHTGKEVVTSPNREVATQPGQALAQAEPRYRYAAPLVDVYETEEGLHLIADLPGVKKEDLEISVKEGVLTLEGKTQLPEWEGGSWLWREHVPTFYRRQFKISETIRVEGIDAELKNGTLRLFLPKAEEAKPRRIEVRVN